MKIDNSISEAFAVYNQFHNNQNLTSKVASAGLVTLRRLIDIDNGDILLGTLVDTVGMPWGTKKAFPRPVEITEKVLVNFSESYFAYAISGFELYTRNLISDLAHFSEKCNKEIFVHAHTDSEYKPTKPPEYSLCCNAYAEQYAENNVLATRIPKICSDLQTLDDRINKLLPLFHYLRNIRNCIVHLNAIANKNVTEIYPKDDFKESWAYWNSLHKKKSPELPYPEREKKIEVNILHCILASAVCFKIAQYLNEHAVKLLREDGFIKMSSYFGLMIMQHEYRSVRKSINAEGLITNYLSNRYFVKDIHSKDVIKLLKSHNLWDICKERYDLIYKKSDKKKGE